jgi:hypothetical protein
MGDVGVQAGERIIGEMKKLSGEIANDEGFIVTWGNKIQGVLGGKNDLASKDYDDFQREMASATLRVQNQQAKAGPNADPYAVVMTQMQMLGEKSQALEEHMKASMPTEEIAGYQRELQLINGYLSQTVLVYDRIAAAIKSTEAEKSKATASKSQSTGEAGIRGQEASGRGAVEAQRKQAEETFREQAALIKQSVVQAVQGGQLKAQAELDVIPKLKAAQDALTEARVIAAGRDYDVQLKAAQDEQSLLERTNLGGANAARLIENANKQQQIQQKYSTDVLSIIASGNTAQVELDTRAMELRLEVQEKGLDAMSRAAEAKMRLDEANAQGEFDKEQGRLKTEETAARGQAELMQISAGTELKQLANLHRQELAAELANNSAKIAALRDFIAQEQALLAQAPAGSNEAKELQQRLTQENQQLQQFTNQRVQIEQKGNQTAMQDENNILKQRQENWKQWSNQVSLDFTTGLNSWIQGQKTFSQAMAGTWNSIVMDTVKALEKIAAEWIAKHLIMGAVGAIFHLGDAASATNAETAKTAAHTAAVTAQSAETSAANVAAVVSYAGVAAAAAFASTCAVPVTGPELAPEAATAAAAAVLEFGAIAAFELGGVVPKTQVAMVHGGERVLTASQNNTFENLIKQGGGSGHTYYMTTQFNVSGVGNPEEVANRAASMATARIQSLFRSNGVYRGK